ncbi:MAG: hypothetical protein EBS84_03630 [Proteobacteria bacterium]|nr:hypothetical protein [Pseudomonadota bacterium]
MLGSLARCVAHFARVSKSSRQRFLASDMTTSFKCSDRHLFMDIIWRCDINQLDGWIRQCLMPINGRRLPSPFPSEFMGFSSITPCCPIPINLQRQIEELRCIRPRNRMGAPHEFRSKEC